MITLFNTTCIYNSVTNKTILYGHYNKMFKKWSINLINVRLVLCDKRPDFYIEIPSKIETISILIFHFDDNEIKYSDIKLSFPFNNLLINLDKNKSAIITTMCKDYGHRLDEWIQYNLKLGFSGIIVFNNNYNSINPINELNEHVLLKKPKMDNYIMVDMKTIVDKYKDKVIMIDFPYSPFVNFHYDNIQRNALHISVNVFKNKCKYIALIDADEFIHIPSKNNIEEFLEIYNRTITMKSNIITNKNEDDIIDNNILKIAEYIGENKYTKTILNTNYIKDNEFIVTPHSHSSELVLEKDVIIHYHCWINERYQYNESMLKINELKNIIYI